MSAALFGMGSQHTSRNLVEFRAGKMVLRDKMVTADNRKGLFYITAGDDGLLHVCWKERNASTPEMELTVVLEECEFTRVTQCKTGRVYLLRFKENNSRKFFFWLQEPSEKRDAELEKKVQDLLRDGVPARSSSASGAASALGALDDSEFQRVIMQDPAQFMQLMSSMGLADVLRPGLGSGPPTQRGTPQASARGTRTRAAQPAQAVAATGAGSSSQQTPAPSQPAVPQAPKANKVQFKLVDLENALSNLQSATGNESDSFEFASILRQEELAKLLEDQNVRDRLAPFLPDAERAQLANVKTPQQAHALADVLRSPQFRQAMNSFGEALRSGQLGPIMTQFGLPESVANAAASGNPTDFAQALQTALSATSEQPQSSSSTKPDETKKAEPAKKDDDKMDQD